MPYKDIEKRRECHRNNKRKHRAKAKKLGLCCNCDRKALFGHTRCSVCRDNHNRYHKKHNRRYRDKYIEEGTGPKCSRDMLGEKQCMSCANENSKLF